MLYIEPIVGRTERLLCQVCISDLTIDVARCRDGESIAKVSWSYIENVDLHELFHGMITLIVPDVFPPVGLSMHAGTECVWETHSTIPTSRPVFVGTECVAHGWVAHLLTYWAPTQVYICWEQNVLHSFQQGRGTVHAQHYINCTDTECSHSVQSFDNACMVHVYTIVLSFWGKL